AEARRLRGAARAPERAAGATRRNHLGALRARDEAPRVRPQRLRLPLEAVLVRRAARARACAAPAWAPRREREHRSRRAALARRRPAPGAARGCRCGTLGPRVQAP